MRNAVVISLGMLAVCCTGCSSAGTSSSTPVSEYINSQVQTRSTAERITDGGTYVAYGQNIELDTTEPITLILHNSQLASISGGHDVTLALTGESEVGSLAVGGIVNVVGSGSLTITEELSAERAVVNSGELSTQEHAEVGCDIDYFGAAAPDEAPSGAAPKQTAPQQTTSDAADAADAANETARAGATVPATTESSRMDGAQELPAAA